MFQLFSIVFVRYNLRDSQHESLIVVVEHQKTFSIVNILTFFHSYTQAWRRLNQLGFLNLHNFSFQSLSGRKILKKSSGIDFSCEMVLKYTQLQLVFFQILWIFSKKDLLHFHHHPNSVNSFFFAQSKNFVVQNLLLSSFFGIKNPELWWKLQQKHLKLAKGNLSRYTLMSSNSL